MALRWREHGLGEIVCAEKHPELPGDVYIDDSLHYLLALEVKVFIPDENEKENGLWHLAESIGG